MWRGQSINADDLKAGEWSYGKFLLVPSCTRLGARINYSDCWSWLQPFFKGYALTHAADLERPVALVSMALGVPGILYLGDSLFMERQGAAASSEFMFSKRKLPSVGKKRIRTSRPQLFWKAYSSQVRWPCAILGPLFWESPWLQRGRCRPVGGGNLVYQPRQRSEAGRVCGWKAGNSLDSRDDTWKGSDSGKEPAAPSISRESEKDTASWLSVWKESYSQYAEIGQKGGSWPDRRPGLGLDCDSWPWPSLCPLSASVPYL